MIENILRSLPIADLSMSPTFSRRGFLRGAASLAVVHSVIGSAQTAGPVLHSNLIRAYVGTYTGTAGSGSNGEGIYRFEMNRSTGELLHPKLVARTRNPSWIVLHPSRKSLYAVNEIADYGDASGSVSAFAVDFSNGDLRALNTVSSQGAGPAHLSIDATGRFAFVANYGGGSIAVLPILPDGSLGAAVDVRRDSDSVGSVQPRNAPAGSFAFSGHDAPHAHMIAADPANQFVLATDLGQDRIYSYRFDSATGKLTANGDQPFVSLPSGDGPRHFAFHPNGHWLFAIQEESSTIATFAYNPATGALTARGVTSALPAGFAGSSFASEILVSADGRFLYAANRLHNSIAVFAIEPDGTLRRVGEASTMGDYPGQCRIDPTGRFLFACNRRSDNISAFAIHPDTGMLTFTGHYTAVGSPACITFF
jgi:6-phosphogluconolactonase (cycloisomerase 2 family)